jgi:hypothetical protein
MKHRPVYVPMLVLLRLFRWVLAGPRRT